MGSKTYKQDYKPTVRTLSAWDLAKLKKTWQSKWGSKKAAFDRQALEGKDAPGPDWEERAWKREKKKSFTKKPKPKPKSTFKKTIGKKDNRGGDTSQFRDYEWYGAYKEMKPKLIIKIKPTAKMAEAFMERKKSGRTALYIFASIQMEMEKMLDQLILYGDFIINKYVPKDTGALREAMVKSIRDTTLKGFRLKMVLDTKGIKYANPVDKMPEEKVRHNYKWRRAGAGKYKVLHDPQAQGGYWDYIWMALKTRAQLLIMEMYKEIIRILNYKQPESGWKRHPGGTHKVKVESQRRRHNRLVAQMRLRKMYTTSKKARKQYTPDEWFKQKMELLRRTRIMLDTEVDRPAKDETQEVTFSKMRHEKYRLENLPPSATAPTVKEYERKDVLGLFKITGMLRGRKR